MKRKFLLLSSIGMMTLTGCNQPKPDARVHFKYGDVSNVTYKVETQENILTKINNGDQFILVVYLEGCACWSIFKNNVLSTFIERTNLDVYAIEVGDVTSDFKGLVSHQNKSSTPLVGIYSDAQLLSSIEYSSRDLRFQVEADFKDWLETVIILPKIIKMNKDQFNAKLKSGDPFIAYYSLTGCPDCRNIEDRFLLKYLTTTKGGRIYSVDTGTEGFRKLNGEANPNWDNEKAIYSLSSVKNTVFGYNTGFVPTLQYIVPDGVDHVANGDITPIVKDMIVTGNDKFEENADGKLEMTVSYFTSERLTAVKYGAGLQPLIGTILEDNEVIVSSETGVKKADRTLVFDYYIPYLKSFLATYYK